jgi:hypothetical protein
MPKTNLSEYLAKNCPDLMAQLKSLNIQFGPFVVAIDSSETGFSMASCQIDLTDPTGDELVEWINAEYDDIDWIDDRKKDKTTAPI